MTLAEFEALVQAYGADLKRWPVSRQEAAEAFLAQSPAATDALAEEAGLDALLDQMTETAPVSADLQAAILAIPDNARQDRPLGKGLLSGLLSVNLSFLAPRFAGVAAAAVIGFYVGMTGMVTLPGDEQEPTFYDLADVVFDVYSEEISL